MGLAGRQSHKGVYDSKERETARKREWEMRSKDCLLRVLQLGDHADEDRDRDRRGRGREGDRDRATVREGNGRIGISAPLLQILDLLQSHLHVLLNLSQSQHHSPTDSLTHYRYTS
ncbi:hypothetical protein C1H46_010521 [Malus baccata]|uniref:Uncharacterized protein n=1 Tax=Malus baccata TaxID=106549 RepID=A0A540MYI7_MALBA|nr:hypothetical protein C1H46_010521 [Malus baccata]